MILQALVQYYEDLVQAGKADRPGWGPQKVSYAIELNGQGEIVRMFSVMEEQLRGKKMVTVPQAMSVPAPVKRSSGVAPNFMCDNSSYLLGVDLKGKPDRAIECFEACKALHCRLLENAESDAAKALLRFFETWEPLQAEYNSVLAEKSTEVLSGVNLVFYYGNQFIHKDGAVISAWQQKYDASDSLDMALCLVSGQRAPIAQLHPSIKGIRGAQSSGASLVSFNAPAFCSYGKEQGQNAPTGEYAAFAYTTALNYLTADRSHISCIGDTAVLFWAKGAETAYQNAFGGIAFGMSCAYSERELRQMLSALCRGEKVLFDGTQLDPEMDFYILGIAPNAARLSVRFFHQNSFGAILSNVEAHHKRMEIQHSESGHFQTIPLWKMLDETVNQNLRDKTPSPQMSSDVLRAILTNTPYPATLLNGVMLRIRAEHEVNRGKAAIIKAYYLKNKNKNVPEEVLTVSLNEESTNTAYVLGRLFSVLESIQEKANPGINATIRDKYFNSASATPAVVFPVLMNLAQKHLRKMDTGSRIYYERQLGSVVSLLLEAFPARMNLPQQGSFQLGYYHQTQARYQGYQKKEEK